ncbi:HNH endonuclease [bacterium]|nr:HNH endonuclease [bacterium]
MSVARLVCTAFHGPPPSPAFVAGHRNDILSDNRAENLYWRPPSQHVGEGNPVAKLREQDVVEMRRRSRAGETYTALAARYGVAISTVYAAVVGRTWKHVPDASPQRPDYRGARPASLLAIRGRGRAPAGRVIPFGPPPTPPRTRGRPAAAMPA